MFPNFINEYVLVWERYHHKYQLKEGAMAKERPQNRFPCNEYAGEIRNALAESAELFDQSNKGKKLPGKEAKSR